MRDTRPTHLDVFSGLGGFTLAAASAGFRTIGFCESDPRCQAFLGKTWPGIPIHSDVRTLDGLQFRGIDIITAGVPCQPASRAGKRQGASDNRWVWPEALRIVEQAEPGAFLFENPPGILDVGIDGILAELETIGYEIGPIFDIPACAVDSPQLRHRLWIVGFRTGNSPAGANESGVAHDGRERCRQDQSRWGAEERTADRRISEGHLADKSSVRCETEPSNSGSWTESATCHQKHLADAERIGSEVRQHQPGQSKEGWACCARELSRATPWSDYVWLPCTDGKVRRAPDDSIRLVNGLHRSLLGALGNSIVWPVAAEILRAIRMTI